MAAIHLALQVLRKTLISPGALATVVLLWGGWWGLEHLLPLGLTTDQTHRLAAHYEVAFMGGAAIALLTAARWVRYETLLGELPPIVRALTEWGACTLAALAVAAALVAPAHGLREWQIEEFRFGSSGPALAIALAHLSALLTMGLRVRARDRVVPLAVAAGAALVVPGLLTGESTLSATLLALLDSSAPLRHSFDFPAEEAHWIRGTLPTLGWVLCAAALASPRRGPRTSATTPISPHALRDPR